MYRIIFEHHPLPDKIIEFQGAWKNSSDIIQTYPGARGTRLFRSLDDPTTFYAIADWESKEARDSAMDEIGRRKDAKSVLHWTTNLVTGVRALTSMNLVAESIPSKNNL